METGTIVSQVFTSRSAIPIEGATLTVTGSGSTENTLLGFRITDINGLTKPCVIDTPPLKLSLTPTPVKPFTSCNLKIDHPDFYTLRISNAQVFSGEETLQIAELIPLKEFETEENSFIDVNVSPQNL